MSDTPRCDRIGYDQAFAKDHREWMHLAIQLERELHVGAMAFDDMKAAYERKVQALLDHCPDAECTKCGKIMCPHEEPLHFHHDGCPACEMPTPRDAASGTVLADVGRQDQRSDSQRPRIVCLIGSVRFRDQFEVAAVEESLAGKIVLMPVWQDITGRIELDGGTREQEVMALRKLHRAKIDLADEVLVMNVDGYVGSDTIDETEYAGSGGKEIRLYEHRAVRT